MTDLVLWGYGVLSRVRFCHRPRLGMLVIGGLPLRGRWEDDILPLGRGVDEDLKRIPRNPAWFGRLVKTAHESWRAYRQVAR